MDVLKNKVEAYNELITTMNEIMPTVVKVFEDTAPNWCKKDGSLLKKVKDRLDPLLGRRGNIMMFAEPRLYSISIVFKTTYPDGPHTCEYIVQRGYVVDNGKVIRWEPMNTVSLDGVKKFNREREELKREVQDMLDRFYSDWCFMPYEFTGNALRLK